MSRAIAVVASVLVLLIAACSELTTPPQAEADPAAEDLLSAQAVGGGVFFSQYIEGSANNKALEIYNATDAAVDLGAGGYNVQMYFNGSTTPGLTINLAGAVAAGEVFVLANSAAAPAILDLADQTNGSGWYNGDDAVVLRAGTTVLDVIGQIGVDPGSQWGSGLVSTQDNTLRRKSTFCSGDVDGSDVFDPAVEWDGSATDDYTGLGSHTITECQPRGDDGDGDGDGGEPGMETCGLPATPIHDVQGPGLASPMAGAMVTIEGVVVGDFQRNDGDPFDTNLGGFHVQEEDAQADADPNTSEGLYVFGGGVDVAVGDLVRVTGTVAEFNGVTELTSVSSVVVCASGVSLPAATVVELPLESVGDLESYEGMRVTFPQALLISEYFNYDRFGEIVLTAPGLDPTRAFQPTAYLDHDDPGVAAAFDLVERSSILLDDGSSTQNPDLSRHPNGLAFTLENRFRGGDIVSDVTGVIDFSFGRYRLQPTQGADYVATNLRPEQPAHVGGSLRAAAFNVLNYFEDFGPVGCGPLGAEDCRGADNAEEFTRQRDKIFAALDTMDAHVVGLIEIENDADQGALIDLVSGLNAVAGAGTYAYVDTDGPVGIDAIKVALIYQPAAVTPVGDPAILDTIEFLDPNDTGEDRNRAALAQTFEEIATGGRFTVVANHFKSKGSPCGVAGDDDEVQGNCNLTRVLAAQVLLDWLQTDPTGQGDPDYLLVGDFNAYDHEEPIFALRAGADGVLDSEDDFADLLREHVGEFVYSYVFDGLLGNLDNAFASASLESQVTGATVWHINADEPDLIDYDTSFKSDAQAALYAPDPFRSSDHDPVLVGLDLDVSPSCDTATASVGTLWPANHTLRGGELLVSDPEGDAVTITIDAIFQDEPVNGDDDGDSSPDAVIGSGGSFELRAERDGEGNGRVYHIAFTASNATASCSGEVTVSAPLSRGADGAAVDDGALFDSTEE